MEIVLSGPGEHHTQLLLGVDVSGGVGGVGDDEHLHGMTVLLGLETGLLQNLLGDDVVVGRDVSLVHHSSVSQGHITRELDETGRNDDVGVSVVEEGGAQHIHGSAGTAEDGQLVGVDGGLADLLGHEGGQSLTQVLSSSTADGVHVISLVERAELGVSGLELLPHVDIFSAGDVHHAIGVLRAPRVLGVFVAVSHVRRERGNVHEGLTTTALGITIQITYSLEYSIEVVKLKKNLWE